MTVLIYGHRGWIGNQFLEIINQAKNVKFVLGQSRIENDVDTENEVIEVNPTHIVSFIGRTHGTIDGKVYTTIDYLEQEGKLIENARDNLFSPLILADIATRRNIHYTYLGTGCIFKYDQEFPLNSGKGFDEESKPNFFGSSYSVIKGFTDRLMHKYEKNVLNLRIRMPITGVDNSRNFITKICNYAKIVDIPNSMTVLDELLPYIVDLMRMRKTGTLNFCNPGTISHGEIMRMYKEYVDPTKEWTIFSEEEQRKILASDRSNNFLITTKLEQIFPEILNIKDSMLTIMKNYNKENKQIFHKALQQNFLHINGQSEHKRNILVTGGCGFIGSNFINYYFDKMNFDKMVNIDMLNYCGKIENINENIRKQTNKYIFIKETVAHGKIISQLLEEYNITHLIHFAAQTSVDASFDNPLQFTHDNVECSHILLECARNYKKLEKIIIVSTDEVYGDSEIGVDEPPKTEKCMLNPTNPYSASKASVDLLAQTYAKCFKMPIIITRGNNVYGPNQHDDKLIPKFIKMLKNDEKLTIHGDGSCLRNFLHTSDASRAFETILEKGQGGEIYNIGGEIDSEISILEISKKLIKLVKNTENWQDWIVHTQDRVYNDKRYLICSQKLNKLGWKQNTSITQGLSALV